MRNWILLGISLVVAAAAVLAAGLNHHTSKFDDVISQAAHRYSLDFHLVKSVIYEESWFRPNVRGASGEFGLMQISMAAASDYRAEHTFPPFHEARLLEPRLNVEIGCWYLRRSLDRYQETPNPVFFALLRYNAGEVRSDKWRRLALSTPVPSGMEQESHYLSQVDFPSTRDYVQRILRRSRARNYWF
jgi:soluble lytic murein transglycosylase